MWSNHRESPSVRGEGRDRRGASRRAAHTVDARRSARAVSTVSGTSVWRRMQCGMSSASQRDGPAGRVDSTISSKSWSASIASMAATGSTVGGVVEHLVRADEGVLATRLPCDVVMAAAAIGKRHHALDRVADDVLQVVGFAVTGMDLDVGRIVIMDLAQGAFDPDTVGPAGDVLARIAIGCVGRGREVGEICLRMR